LSNNLFRGKLKKKKKEKRKEKAITLASTSKIDKHVLTVGVSGHILLSLSEDLLGIIYRKM